ncbi:hypothetical protein CH063_08123 [Colletotrichum higginsianum]|uniref:Uncharacterized protein n=1 Tax=Colletotrichum higginsianum (strain IMI 349063) TaxID=759273 RepID=H1V8N7_COLHI|nr:hypothetical protein CH063_08123 [Colletotrichum higginsianum]
MYLFIVLRRGCIYPSNVGLWQRNTGQPHSLGLNFSSVNIVEVSAQAEVGFSAQVTSCTSAPPPLGMFPVCRMQLSDHHPFPAFWDPHSLPRTHMHTNKHTTHAPIHSLRLTLCQELFMTLSERKSTLQTTFFQATTSPGCPYSNLLPLLLVSRSRKPVLLYRCIVPTPAGFPWSDSSLSSLER